MLEGSQPGEPRRRDISDWLLQEHETDVEDTGIEALEGATQEELLGRLWPETFVEEANLTQQVFVLRRTLNRDSKSADYITTIPRRGYRFTAAVVERSDNGRPAAEKQNKRWNRKSTWLGVSLAAGVRSIDSIVF